MKQRYIIYDWVMLNGMKVVVRETYTDANNSFVYVVNDEKYKVEDLKGIPLTTKILENNGWKKYNNEYYKNSIFLNKANLGGWDVYIGEEFMVTIKYIHQLQHLLFGLNINYEMEV